MGIADDDLLAVVKDFGRESQARMDFSSSTGIVSLDAALGGRLPAGAIEIYGESSVGKTTLLYEIITSAQDSGMAAALCPSEYLDIPYMRSFGVDLDSLILFTGNTGEYVLEAACRFIEDNKILARPCILAIDSATGLRPHHDEFGNWTGMIATFLEVVLPALGEGSCVVMTNQIRMKRSVHPDKFFVNGQVDTTARRIVDSFSARLELGRMDVTETDYTMTINVVSSLFSMPSTVLSVPVVKGHGVDVMRDLVRVARDAGAITQAGTWYSWNDVSLGQGEEGAANLLTANPKLADRILDDVMKGA